MATRFTVRDKQTLYLAVGFLTVFFFFFGVAFFEGLFFPSANDYTGIERVSAYLGFIPGAILGYYFQQERIQSLRERVQSEERRGMRAREAVVMTSNNSLPLVTEEIEFLRLQMHLKDDIIQNKDRIIERLTERISNR